MTRLDQKCLLSSMAIHSLAFILLLLVPLLPSRVPQSMDLPVLNFIPSKLVDELMSGGGGSPQPSVSPPVTPVLVPSPVNEPVQQPESPPRERQPPVVPPPVPKPVVQEAVKPPKETAGKNNSIKISKELTTRNPKEAQEAQKKAQEAVRRAEAQRHAQARRDQARQIESRLDNLARSLSSSLSSGTQIEIPGPGGEAYANYSQAVKSIYDKAWVDPGDVGDDSRSVRVRIEVWRDGTLKSQRIVDPSGVQSLDVSVQNALDRVRGLPPFPEGAKENSRVFIINFNLKAKRAIG